jgi:hypothetical protein
MFLIILARLLMFDQDVLTGINWPWISMKPIYQPASSLFQTSVERVSSLNPSLPGLHASLNLEVLKSIIFLIHDGPDFTRWLEAILAPSYFTSLAPQPYWRGRGLKSCNLCPQPFAAPNLATNLLSSTRSSVRAGSMHWIRISSSVSFASTSTGWLIRIMLNFLGWHSLPRKWQN